MIISIVNQKGGTGKSTIATNLCCYFASEGGEVFLIDADPEQHTSMNWLADRSDELPVIHGASLPARNLIRESFSLREKYQHVIVDGGARVTEHAHAAVAVADLIIIPCRPSRADLDSSATFIEIVKGDMLKRPGLKGAVLLTQVQPKTSVTSVTRDLLDQWQFAVFDNYIQHRVDYIEALWACQSVMEYDAKSAASLNFMKFFLEVKELLK